MKKSLWSNDSVLVKSLITLMVVLFLAVVVTDFSKGFFEGWKAYEMNSVEK